MSSFRIGTIAMFLACATAFSSSSVNAQGRGPAANELRDRAPAESDAVRAAKLAELDTWLRRLMGRFRLKQSTIYDLAAPTPCENARRRNPRLICKDPPSPPPLPDLEGLADCVGIGAGPGVHCVLNLVGPRGERIRTFPQMFLFGLDTGPREIRFLKVDGASLAEAGQGHLEKDKVTFKIQCPRISDGISLVLSCREDVKIHAPPHGRFVEISIFLEVRHDTPGALDVDHPVYVFMRLQRL